MYLGEDGEPKLKRSTKMKPYVQFIVDLVILLLVVGVMVILVFTTTPRHIGFECNDKTIKYPKLEKLIPTEYLIVAAVFIGLPIILILELVHKYSTLGFYGSFVSFLKYFGFLQLGLFSVFITHEVLSKTKGRLRPFFWAACMPGYDESLCDKGNFIQEYTCMSNATMEEIDDARTSNPSGDSATPAYVAVWLCVYCHFRMRNPFTNFLKLVVQGAMIATTYWIGLTRVNDLKHNYEDVFAGFCLGAFTAIWIILASKDHLDYNTQMFAVVENYEPEKTLPRKTIHYNRETETSGAKILTVGGK